MRRGRWRSHVGLAALAVAVAAAVLVCAGTRAEEADDSVFVSGGTFTMGTAPAAVAALEARYHVAFPGVFEHELPAHRVTVSGFRLARHETTKAEFARFLDDRPEWQKSHVPATMQNGHYLEDWRGDRPSDDEGAYPVVFVTWHAAQAYCRWRGGRLPTEAEWEYAARAGGDAEFPWGEATPSPDLVNYAAGGRGAPTAVGSYAPNALGLYDMAGNVWELLLDDWQPYPNRAEIDPIAGGPVADAALRSVQGRRVLRGGSYAASPLNLRTRWRDSHVVTNAVAFVGFRCAYPVAR